MLEAASRGPANVHGIFQYEWWIDNHTDA